jgi:hypothetical protein
MTGLRPYEKRVTDEKAELDGKIERLSDFMLSEKFKSLEENISDLLKTQCHIMKAYSNVLHMRINGFK